MPAIYTFPGYREQGKRLANAIKFPCYDVNTRHFPDKESLVTLPHAEHKHVIFCLSLDYPNNKLIELLLAAKTAKKQGVKRLSLVAPYLCYMRQDKAFQSGEAISQQIIGQWLSELFDDVITVDPHLHRITSLDEVIPGTNNVVISATSLLGDFVNSLDKKVILIGPDEESLQWVKQVARVCHADYMVATKKRHSDIKVTIELPEKDYQNKHVILVDDVISTGNTMAQTAQELYLSGVSQVDVLATHALFSNNANVTLEKANIQNIYSSDSIPHPSNCIMLNQLLAQSLCSIL